MTTYDPFPVPSDPAWAAMNRRRGELIRKGVYGVLSISELAEYEYLQEGTRRALREAFPAPEREKIP